MTKSLSSSFIGLYTGILTDVCVYHPTLHKDCERDLKRLKTLTSTMGAKVFTLMLPAIGKVLDASFQSGSLDFDGIPLSRSYSRKTKIPRLFRGIWLLIADDSGCLKHDIDPNDILFLRTLLLAGKKYQTDCDPSAVYATVKEYYDVDNALPPPSQIWDGDGSDLDPSRDPQFEDFASDPSELAFDVTSGRERRLLHAAQQVADRVSGSLGEFLPRLSRFRHGPGAVSDLNSRKDFKYSFPSWGPRLQWIFPAVDFAMSSIAEGLESDDYESAGLPLIEGASRLYAVPKTQKGPRLIAAEPTCHQWCQQSVRSFLTDAIKASPLNESIDFGRQDLSGELALSASSTGLLATVDLSAASDRLSCAVVERIFRRNPSILSALVATRTRYLLNDIDKKSPSLHKLRKFASMGSALTFPVQSIVFYVLCVTAGLVWSGVHENRWREIGRQVRVYGDDLIVPVSWMPLVEELFKALYLKINRAKTFTNGKFRESCGSDCFDGTYVSPGQVRQFYEQSKLSTLQGVVQSANNLYLKGMWHAADALLSSVPVGIRKLIPTVTPGSGSFGLYSAGGFSSSAKKRWNSDLQRTEYAVLTFGSRRSRTFKYEGSANLLQYFTEDPSSSQISDWESGLVAEPLPVARKGWVGAE